MKTQFQLLALMPVLISLVSLNAQPSQVGVTEANEAQMLQLVQRVLQYEILLDMRLEPNLALCIDEKHHGAWMLPAKSSSEISAQATERVRRTLEICQTGLAGEKDPPRLAGQIKAGLNERLQLAMKLDAAKEPIRKCLSQSRTQDALKTCMNSASPDTSTNSDWWRWAALFARQLTNPDASSTIK